jgi:hypothetical protein
MWKENAVAQYRLVKRHADVDLGPEVSGLHGRGRTNGLDADGDVRAQLDGAPPDHRFRKQELAELVQSAPRGAK